MTKAGQLPLRKVEHDREGSHAQPNMAPNLDENFQFKSKARLNLFTMILTSSTLFVLPLAVYVAVDHVPIHIPPLQGMLGRLVFALRCQGMAIVPFALGILVLMVGRIRGKDRKHLDATERYVRHSLEQYVMLLVNTVVMATYIPEDYIKMVPVFVGVWVVGRFVYWLSYSLRPVYRGFAYGIAMLPNLGMMGYNLFAMFSLGFAHDVALYY